MLNENLSAEGFILLREIRRPKLSAAMTTPSLNFTASTDVPVTVGEDV